MALVLIACVPAVVTSKPDEPVKTVAPEVQQVDPRVEAIHARVVATQQNRDDALWEFWVNGTPLPTPSLDGGTIDAELSIIREALQQPKANVARLAPLLHALEAEHVARALAEVNADTANIAATITFPLDGKDISLREVQRMLSTEKSAVKRKALWRASAVGAERLSLALARRDDALAGALSALDAGTWAAWELSTRGATPTQAVSIANEVLAQTDSSVGPALQRLAAVELRLAPEKLSRADLPRLLHAPAAEGDVLFNKGDVLKRGLGLLEGLGLSADAGLVLDVAERTTRQPLPLTVQGHDTVPTRVSFKAFGGLFDEQQLLEELGVAIAATTQPNAARLKASRQAQAAAALLGELLQTAAWLQAPEELATRVSEAVAAARMLSLRRAAAVVLLRFDEAPTTEDDQRARFSALFTRALGVRLSADDAARWRVETDDAARAYAMLQGALDATQLRAKLIGAHGAAWWTQADAGPHLRALLRDEPPASTVSAVDAWARSMTITSTPRDGGLTVGPWPQPATLSTDAGTIHAGPWPQPATLAVDAGTIHAGPWPQPATLATDAGVDAGS